jgi:uncharacterized lipoprotein YddW (UPF0748 family)
MTGRIEAAARLAAVCIGMWVAAAPAQTPEFRALWVDTFHSGIKSSAQITTLVNDLRAGNFNAVLPEVRKRGDAYYLSNFEPEATDMTSTNSLAELIARAHNTNGGAARIEVHAWIVTYNIWNNRSNAPPQPDHPYNLHPDWLTRNDAGVQWDGGNYAFDPGHPEVQRHTFNVAMDIISRYDVDGFNFDYIRYAGNTWGYNPVTVARFNRRFGRTGQPTPTDPDWLQFRRDQVTALVRKVYLSTMAIKPHVKISADTITWAPGPTSDTSWTNSSAAYRNVLQDWRSWMQEGILDLNIPMAYFDQAGAYTTSWTNWNNFTKDHRYNRHAAIGPGIYMNTMADVLRQMRFTRAASPSGNFADGVVGYSYAVPVDPADGVSRATFLAALTQTNTSLNYETNVPPIFATRVPTPVMPWKTAPTRGHIKGFVYGGSTTNPLDGAQVTVTGVVQRTALADATGFYGFVDLPPGNYGVSSTSSGFALARSNLTVTAGLVSTADLLLTTNESIPPILANIMVDQITDHSARVNWSTDEPANTIVDYGTSAAYEFSVTNSALVTAHNIVLNGLAPDTMYHYRVRSRDAQGNLATSGDFTFATNPTGVVSDLIVDNPQASVTGAWSSGISALDKYGSDYRFKAEGTGSDYLQFAPTILTAGRYAVYEWHPEGGNRTTNAQHTITFQGGTSNVFVNQKINGGQWNLLGAFNFAAGTNGHVRITDNFPDTAQVVLADAIKFVYAPPTVPPSITAQPQSRIARAGSNVTFNVTASGTAPLSYQWRLNGGDLANATNSALTLLNVATNDAGLYSVAVSNSQGSALSSNASLTVTLPVPPSITLISLLPTNRVQLTISSEAGYPVEVEASEQLTNWMVIGNLVNTNGTAVFIDLPPANRRYYRVLGQ